MADTRKDKRAPVSLKVRFKSATVDEFIEQYAADISRGGVFIKSKQPMPVGTLLKFEIQLKDESPLIHGVGRVVWKREGGDVSVESPSGMGIKFIRMDPDCRVMVEKIITMRGDEPGQFESGGGDPEDEGAPAAPARATKGTIPFFPAAGPTEAEMPRPEDRTQVRHASEFLASALAEAGSDESAREAERKAEEARRRTEEIERARSREEQARAADAERERAEAADREKAARAAAEESAAKAIAASAAETRPDASPAKTAPVEEAKPAKAEDKAEEKKAEKAAAKPEEAKAAKATKAEEKKAEDKKPKAEEKKAEDKKPKAAVIADRPPPLEEPQSYALPIAIGVVVVLGIIGVVWSQSQGEAPIADVAPTSETATAPVDEIVEPPVPELEGHGTEPEGTEPVEGTAEGTAEVVPEVAPEPPPETPMAHFRVETTPPGATIVIAGSERGTSPAELDLAIGTAATITARLPGYLEGTQEVTPTATQRPVRIALVAMPYVIEVTTTPPGARVRAGGRTATTSADAPSRMTVSRPTAPVTVGASRSGYTDGSETVLATAFQERNGEMVATVAITLTERPVTPTTTTTTRPPRERTGTTTTTGGTTTGGTTGDTTTTTPEPEPEPEPVREPPPPREPTPEPEPEEAPPDNPF